MKRKLLFTDSDLKSPSTDLPEASEAKQESPMGGAFLANQQLQGKDLTELAQHAGEANPSIPHASVESQIKNEHPTEKELKESCS